VNPSTGVLIAEQRSMESRIAETRSVTASPSSCIVLFGVVSTFFIAERIYLSMVYALHADLVIRIRLSNDETDRKLIDTSTIYSSVKVVLFST